MTSPYFTPPRPRLFAHRGASAHFPENTLPAFEAAVTSGLLYLEMDVWATRDGHVVVHHDPSLQRLTGRKIDIRDITLDELRRLDAGHTFSSDGSLTFPFRGKGIVVPTLTEVFNALPGVFCNIEVKQESPPIDELVLETIRSADREETVLLAAESDRVMTRLRPLCGDIPTSFSFAEAATFFAWLKEGRPSGYTPPGRALQIPEKWGDIPLVTEESVRAAHAIGLEVHVWTVNSREDVRRLLRLGVDGVMSDYPEYLFDTSEKIL